MKYRYKIKTVDGGQYIAVSDREPAKFVKDVLSNAINKSEIGFILDPYDNKEMYLVPEKIVSIKFLHVIKGE